MKKERKYTKDHEWIELNGNIAKIGISYHAQDQLGDIVFIELPDIDQYLTKKSTAAVVESVKSASDVYAPLSGKVTEVNSFLNDKPELVNESPEDEGWFFKMTIENPEQLDKMMDIEGYQKLLNSSE